LGHIQRGGSPSARDRVLASEMGVKSIEALLNGDTHHCICDSEGKIISIPIENALGDDTQPVRDKYKVFKVLW